jgi:hypothetical protein
MATYLAEVYAPMADGGLPRAIARARVAAAAMSREGTPIRHVRALHIPEDETCFHVFEGPTPEAVRETGRRAGLAVARVVEVVE